MEALNPLNITLDAAPFPIFNKANIEVSVLRLDKIHSVISGNKWFKLRYYLEDFKKSTKKALITFGGAWSNHIVATAAACNQENIPCIGIIRGEEAATLSTTLIEARNYGMHLIFITRQDFKQKKLPQNLLSDENYIIPEGGYGILGMQGAATILEFVNKNNFTHVCCAAGTGTMAAGILKATNDNQQVVVISALRNNISLLGSINSLTCTESSRLQIFHDYHFGGYAHHQPELLKFMNEFYQQTKIPSDFVYTGKMFFAIADLATLKYFPEGSKLLLIHSGGLQGNTSLEKGTLIF